jgi:hypothetical protein
MKRMLLLVVFFISSSLLGIASIETWASPAAAQRYLDGSLYSPNNAERFFKAGHQSMEHEIQLLQQDPHIQVAEVLKIDPAIAQQMRDWQEQQDRQFLTKVREQREQNPRAETIRRSTN